MLNQLTHTYLLQYFYDVEWQRMVEFAIQPVKMCSICLCREISKFCHVLTLNKCGKLGL